MAESANPLQEKDVENFPTHINLLTYLFVVVSMFSVPLETTSGE
jgi:hypothetical protein